ncbi:MAG: heavy-metal-associated domain-containing protein [FCB group bacterium]|nr:heavy-metal-associated domain-containing protein [FCB group bacterium]
MKLQISGMNCDGCVQAVKEALLEIDGVDVVVVDLESGTADIQMSSADISIDQLVISAKLAGYGATLAGD